MREPSGKDIRHRVFMAKPLQMVFDTITDGGGWNAFFTHATEIDPAPGGELVAPQRLWGCTTGYIGYISDRGLCAYAEFYFKTPATGQPKIWTKCLLGNSDKSP